MVTCNDSISKSSFAPGNGETLNDTLVTGLKILSIGIIPTGELFNLFSSLDLYPFPIPNLNSTSNVVFLSISVIYKSGFKIVKLSLAACISAAVKVLPLIFIYPFHLLWPYNPRNVIYVTVNRYSNL